MKTANKPPRKLRLPSDSGDENEAVNNAIWLAYQFTSRLKLATLERLPTPGELLNAMDIFERFESVLNKMAPEQSKIFRGVAMAWEAGTEVPEALIESARAFFFAMNPKIPKGGWDASDGYPYWEQDEGEPAAEISEPEEYDPSNPSHRARRLAIAFLDFLNVGAMLAAPRAWANRKEFPSQEHLLGHVDGFLATFEAMPRQGSMREMAEQLRSMLASWEPGPEIPEEITRVARSLMDYARMPEPPGGWDGGVQNV